MLAYLNGQYLPEEEIVISPDDRGFLFADGLYEMIRSYNGILFQTKAHLERLNYGARALRFKTTDFHYLAEATDNLIKENELFEGEATVYIQRRGPPHPLFPASGNSFNHLYGSPAF